MGYKNVFGLGATYLCYKTFSNEELVLLCTIQSNVQLLYGTNKELVLHSYYK